LPHYFSPSPAPCKEGPGVFPCLERGKNEENLCEGGGRLLKGKAGGDNRDPENQGGVEEKQNQQYKKRRFGREGETFPSKDKAFRHCRKKQNSDFQSDIVQKKIPYGIP
jgi:hypothetical protein